MLYADKKGGSDHFAIAETIAAVIVSKVDKSEDFNFVVINEILNNLFLDPYLKESALEDIVENIESNDSLSEELRKTLIQKLSEYCVAIHDSANAHELSHKANSLNTNNNKGRRFSAAGIDDEDVGSDAPSPKCKSPELTTDNVKRGRF